MVLLAASAGLACRTPARTTIPRRETKRAPRRFRRRPVECRTNSEAELDRDSTCAVTLAHRTPTARKGLPRALGSRLRRKLAPRCAPAQRRCLARAKSPPLALETCGINQRSPAEPDRVLFPSLAAHVTLTEPPRTGAEGSRPGARILVRRVGQRGRRRANQRVWSFSSGARLHIRERKANAESEETFRVSFPARHRMTLERAGHRKQDMALFRSRDALYVSRGLSYDVVPLFDRARITLRHDTSYVFFGPEGCEVDCG